MTSRRDLLFVLCASALGVRRALAQQKGKVLRIGFLVSIPPSDYRTSGIEAFKRGLGELGYVEGKNLVIEWRYADGKYELLPGLAAELVKLNVDVLVTSGTPGTRALKQATSRIPIVMATAGDAIVTGLVSGLARPGGNVTGSTFFSPQLMAKRLEILKEILPKARQVAVLVNAANPTSVTDVEKLIIAAESMKIAVPRFAVRANEDFEGAFSAMAAKHVDAVVIQEDALLNGSTRALAEHAGRHKLPSIGFGQFAVAGGMVGYGANLPEMFRRAAYFVDRIAKGAQPGDLPIEQASKFELIVNQKAAIAIGVKLPEALLLRADRVIE